MIFGNALFKVQPDTDGAKFVVNLKFIVLACNFVVALTAFRTRPSLMAA